MTRDAVDFAIEEFLASPELEAIRAWTRRALAKLGRRRAERGVGR